MIKGFKELVLLDQYARKALTEEERKFLEKMKNVEQSSIDRKGESFSSVEELGIKTMWRKYEHLKPFQFRFDPEKKMPEVFQNRTAFIIWTAWRARHLTCEEDLVKEASIAAARIILDSKPPFAKNVKERTIKEFVRYLHPSYTKVAETGEEEIRDELSFWKPQIFPFLEGKWEFKWEMIQKCFYCSKDAIAICNSCSPTSSTGLTLEKHLCEDCIVNGIGINIIKWLIPEHEGKKKIEYAVRKPKSKEIRS